MKNFICNKHGQFVVIAALIIAVLTLATVISVYEISINNQTITYKPVDEFLLGLTSDMNRALSVSLAKYTSDLMTQNPTDNAYNLMSAWKQSTLTAYANYGIAINPDLPADKQNLNPKFDCHWDGTIGSSYAYIPYNLDINGYGFLGWTGSTLKYVQIQIFPDSIDTSVAGQTSLKFNLTQSSINQNVLVPISDLAANPTSASFRVGPYAPDQPFTPNNTPSVQYLGTGQYKVTFNQVINPLTNGVRIDLSTPNDGIWVSANYYNKNPPMGSTSTSTILSVNNGGSVSLGNQITDSATVTGVVGAPNPTGNIIFQVKALGADWVSYSIKALDSASHVTSDNYTPLAAGDYYFRAIYGGDLVYTGSQSGDAEEHLVVTKAGPVGPTPTPTPGGPTPTPSSTPTPGPGGSTPTPGPGVPTPTPGPGGPTPTPTPQPTPGISIRTQLSTASVSYGGQVTDTAIVTGLGGAFPTPSGTVEFYSSTDGAVTWTKYDTKSLSGGSATSASYTDTFVGTTYFKAVYLGDSNYEGTQSGSQEEPLVVSLTPNQPSHATTLLSIGNTGSVALGNTVKDTVTVTGIDGASKPTGTVIFQVKTPSANWAPFSVTALDATGSASSSAYLPLSIGDYYFRAVYSGDILYAGSQSGDTEEHLTVTRAGADGRGISVQTQLSAAAITWGAQVTDTAIVSGLNNPFPIPTGTVDFYTSGDGGTTWVKYDTKALVSGSATSATYTPPSFAPAFSGVRYFKAVYSGDANYYGSESGKTDEPLTVNSMAPGTTGDYYLAAAIPCGQNPFLTNDKSKVPPPPSLKVNPALSNGHMSQQAQSENTLPTIVTANQIKVTYDMAIKQSGQVQCDLGFTYNGVYYSLGSATFTANPVNEYYTVTFDVTGKTFVNGFPPQTIPNGSTLILKTTLMDPKNRVYLEFGLTGTQITLFPPHS